MSKNKKSINTELCIALQSAPIVYIPHFDYEMMDRELESAIKKIGLTADSIAEYDMNLGVVDFVSKKQKKGNEYAAVKQLDAWLNWIVEANPEEADEERVFLFKNFQEGVLDNFRIQSYLQTFAAKYKHGDYEMMGPVFSIVIVSPMPVMRLPFAIEKIFTVLDYFIPEMDEIREIVKGYPVAASVTRRKNLEQFQEELTYTLLGLHMYEVNQILHSIVARSFSGTLDNNSIADALEEKQRIVRKSGIIEVVEPDTSFDDVGGLDKLKEDLNNKSLLYRNLNEIQDEKGKIRLPIPKGVLIIGMPGCGKTMIAKAVADKFGVSLLRLDVNRLMGQYVGMSEENLRRALQTAETAHPCVLWIDEVEKAFAGAGANGGENDMLVQRLMGQFLTWMQERKTAVYIVATANDVMRPEFMRKGRFDEVYFVDFPNLEERKSILRNKMGRYGYLDLKTNTIYDFSEFTDNGRENDNFNKIAALMVSDGSNEKTKDGLFSNGFSGAEIESVVNQVMENVYVKYRLSIDAKEPIQIPIKISVSDFEEAVKAIRPSVMANQLTPDQEKRKNPLKATNIERIREMQNIYHFIKATK